MIKFIYIYISYIYIYILTKITNLVKILLWICQKVNIPSICSIAKVSGATLKRKMQGQFRETLMQ